MKTKNHQLLQQKILQLETENELLRQQLAVQETDPLTGHHHEEAHQVDFTNLYNFFRSLKDGWVTIDGTGKFKDFNKAYQEMLGYTREELLEMTFWDITPLHWHKREKMVMHDVVHGEGFSETYEKEYITKDNKLITVEIQAFVFKSGKEIKEIHGIVKDRTRYRETQIELRASEITYRELFNAIGSPIYIHNYHTTELIDVNQAALNFHGLNKNEILGTSILDYTVQDSKFNQRRIDKLFQEVKQKGKVRFEWHDKGKSNQDCWTENEMKIATINGIKRIIVIANEITERKKNEEELNKYRLHLEKVVADRTRSVEMLNEDLVTANKVLNQTNDLLAKENAEKSLMQKALENSEEKFRNFMMQSSNGFALLDENAKILEWNESLAFITGLEWNDVVGKKVEKILKKLKSSDLERDKDIIRTSIESSRVGKVWSPVTGERSIKNCKSSEKKHLQVSIFPVQTSHNLFIGIAINDLTEKKRKEEELHKYRHQLEKMVEAKTNELKESVYRYQTLFEQAADGIILSTVDKKIVDVNKSICKLTGYTKSQLIRLHPEELFETRELVNKPLLWKEVGNGELIINERYIKRGDKTLVPIEMRTKMISDKLIQVVFRDITERKKAEEANELIKNIFENIQLGMYIYQLEDIHDDTSLRLVMGNPATEKLTGLYVKDIIGNKILENFPALEEKNIHKKYADVIRDQKAISFNDLYYKDNRLPGAVYAVKAFPLSENRVGVSFDNITEQKIAEEKIKISEEKFRLLYESANDTIMMLKDGIIMDCNNKALKDFGCKRDYLIGKSPDAVSPIFQPSGKPSDIEARKYIQSAEISGKTDVFEWVHKKENGELFFTEVGLSVIHMQNERIVQAIVRDITERKKASEDLKRREALLNAAINNIPFEVWARDMHERNFLQNNYSRKLWGDKVGKKMDETGVDKETLEKWRENNKRAFNGEIIDEEIEVVDKKGRQFFFRNILAPIKMEDEMIGIIGVNIDVTGRILAEKKVLESESKFRNIFNHSIDGIMISSPNSKILEANKAMTKDLGYSKKQLLAMRTLDLVTDQYKSVLSKRAVIFRKGKIPPSLELDVIKQDGNIMPVEINSTLIDYAGGKAVLTMIRDITLRLQMRKKLMETIIETEEKERELLAGDLHDEIGPLLSSLNLYVSSLKPGSRPDRIEFIINQLRKIIKQTIRNIREISNNLSPHILNNFGLESAINASIEHKKELLRFHFNTNLKNRRFNSKVEIVVYRIINELINNTLKYASADSAYISIHFDENELNVEYKNDGKKFDFKKYMAKKEKKGIGLLNIIGRVKSLSGSYEFDNDDNYGLIFRFNLESEEINDGIIDE